MKCRIQYAPLAIQDLERVWSEVCEASKDPEVAARYVDDLMDRISAKKDFPKSGSPLYYESSFTGYYFVTFKAYIAFYRVQEDRILVDRVVYGKSDYIRTLFRRLNP